MKMQSKKYSTFHIRYSICILFLSLSTTIATFAQKDTTKKGTTIDITSSYKPVLRNAVKINFAASQLNADTSKPKMN